MLVMIAGVLVVLWMVVGWLVITVLNLPSRPQPQPRLRKDSATRGTQGGAGGAEDSAIHRDTGRCSRESDRSSAKRNGVIFDNYSANLIKDFAAAQDSANLIKDFTAAQDNAKATEESVNDADDSTRDSATDDRGSATPVNTTEVTESAATFLRYRGDKCGTTASIDNATWPAAALPSKWQGDRGEWQGEVEQGRRQRLLKRRRRLISRLYDTSQDAEEILRLYFTSPSASRSASPHPDLPATLRRRSAPLPASPTPERGRGARVSLREEAGTAGQEVLYLASSDDSGISVGGRDLPASPLLPHCQVWCLALPRSCLSPALLNLPDSALPHCQPTIFGTVADETTPRDNTTKRGLPQTPKSGAKSCPYNGVDTPAQDWPPTPDDDNSLVYEDGVLVSGSLQALVQHAVPTAVYYPDTAYLFAFLLSSRLFVKPHDLLQRVCDVGFTQQGLQGNDLASINKEKLGGFVPHMVQLLGEWSETFPYDFRDERMMSGVRTMTHRCIALQPALRRDVTQVLHNLLNKLTQLERYEEAQAKLSVPPPSDFIPLPTDITEVCQSPLVMAQQLTHIELEKLSYIGPEEFVQAFAKDNLDACYKDLKKTSNLECYIQWFNRLSYLVATHACTHVKRKQRVRVIEWWIEVARECFNIGNFNSLMGIIAGLNMSIVSRLKKTWSKVQSAKFSVLEHQMDPSSNFSSYRSTLKAAMWRSAGAVDDRQKIVIPFFSLLVKDLYFLNEGCASRLRNGHINFDKFWQLAKQVTEFMAWKQVSCPFEKVTHVIIHMQTTNVLTETGLALASFECEGPDNSYEKERYKNLKADTQPPPERE